MNTWTLRECFLLIVGLIVGFVIGEMGNHQLRGVAAHFEEVAAETSIRVKIARAGCEALQAAGQDQAFWMANCVYQRQPMSHEGGTE